MNQLLILGRNNEVLKSRLNVMVTTNNTGQSKKAPQGRFLALAGINHTTIYKQPVYLCLLKMKLDSQFWSEKVSSETYTVISCSLNVIVITIFNTVVGII